MNHLEKKPDAPDPPFSLTQGERDTALWRRFEEYLAERIDRVRRKNDNPMLSPERTAMLRGEIQCLKGFQNLGKDRPPQGGR